MTFIHQDEIPAIEAALAARQGGDRYQRYNTAMIAALEHRLKRQKELLTSCNGGEEIRLRQMKKLFERRLQERQQSEQEYLTMMADERIARAIARMTEIEESEACDPSTDEEFEEVRQIVDDLRSLCTPSQLSVIEAMTQWDLQASDSSQEVDWADYKDR